MQIVYNVATTSNCGGLTNAYQFECKQWWRRTAVAQFVLFDTNLRKVFILQYTFFVKPHLFISTKAVVSRVHVLYCTVRVMFHVCGQAVQGLIAAALNSC